MRITAAMETNNSSKPREILVYQREKKRMAIVHAVKVMKAIDTVFNRGPWLASRSIPG